ncbi:MAG: hypothetical protein ABIK73_08870 [candidate division WOR-3 bacterium]
MVKVSWVKKNIFTSWDMPAYITIDAGYTHRLKVYESETIIYVDDTVTGTNRPATLYEVRVWETNPHGTPPQTPAIYNLYVDVYDTNNVLKERITLKYMYGAGKYRINIVDENNNTFEAQIYYCIRTSSDVFADSYYGSNISIVDRGVNDLILEIIRVRDGKKYYMISKNPTLYTNTTITLYPKSEFIIKVVYDVSMFNNIPGLKQLYNFIMWLGTRIYNVLIPLAQSITNLLGIPLPIVKVEYDNGLLIVYYVNDPIPILPIIIAIVAGALGITIALVVRDILVSETTYKIEQLVHDSYTQYLNIIKEIKDFASTTPNPEQTFIDLISKITPPQVSTKDTKSTLDQKDNMISQLKDMLMLAIGGAIVIAVLLMVKK